MDCLFCNIVLGKIPCQKVYEDEDILAFKDLEPIAPVHVLIIPKLHIASLNDVNEENAYLVTKLLSTISTIAKELGLEQGYRVINNCGDFGGQTVKHLHFHLVGGKRLGWPKL